MSGLGIVMLDPDRLARLEGDLEGTGEALALRARCVELALTGTGRDASAQLASLLILRRWCGDQRADIARRRLMVAALPTALPRPRVFATRAEAVRAAERTAMHVRRWIDGDVVLSPAEVARLWTGVVANSRDPEYAAEFFRTLGPRISSELGERVQALWPRHPSQLRPPTRRVEEVQAALVTALGAASTAVGRDRLPDDWFRAYAGLEPGDTDWGDSDDGREVDDETKRRIDLTQSTLEAAGYANGAATVLAKAAGEKRILLIAKRVGKRLAVIGLVSTAVDIAQGGLTDDQLPVEVVASSSMVVAAFVPPPWNALPLTVAGMFTMIAIINGNQQNRRAPGKRRVDGKDVHPSGSESNPNVDAAGVPLPR